MRNLLLSLLVLAASAGSTAVSRAEPASKPLAGGHDNDAPINITSVNVKYDTNGKDGTFVGNVVVIQGDATMRADQVHVVTVNGKADKIYASGNVVADSPNSGIVTGDKGVYSVGPRTSS